MQQKIVPIWEVKTVGAEKQKVGQPWAETGCEGFRGARGAQMRLRRMSSFGGRKTGRAYWLGPDISRVTKEGCGLAIGQVVEDVLYVCQ